MLLDDDVCYNGNHDHQMTDNGKWMVCFETKCYWEAQPGIRQ